jgi:sigma-B regulation protein RsbU (phosphoserine phosphatase)
MLGWPGAEIIGKPYDEILHHTKTRVEDADQQRPIDLTLQFGTSCWFEKDEFSRRDGTTFPVEFTSTPLRDDDRGAGAVVVFRDISERQRRMLAEHELRTARALQRLLYPAAPPQLPGFDIAGAVFPAAMACGDYFDFVPLPDGQLAFAVGDVSGHGLGSALYMVQTRAYLRAILKSDHDEVGVVKRLNELLVQNKSDDFFLTLFFGTLDPRTGTLRYAGAGHDARLLRADGTVEELPSTGTVLAIFEDLKLRRVAPLRLHPGDMLLLVTDGLTETYAPDRSMWGWPPILDLAGQHRERPATSLVETLKKEAEGFAQGGPQLDDVTIVVAKVL